jgi:hypothetical protein
MQLIKIIEGFDLQNMQFHKYESKEKSNKLRAGLELHGEKI